MRLIHLLEQQERKSILSFDDQAKTYRWKKHDFPKTLPSGTPALKESSYKGSRLDIPFHVKTIYTNFILDYLQEIGDVDCIVELGCGYGRNLFELFDHGGQKTTYFGGELTDSGCALGDTLSLFMKDQNITFHKFDHTAPDLSWLPSCNRIFFYTVHSIEQVHQISVDFFKCLAKASQDVIGMHLEPFGFQCAPDLGDVSKIQAEQFQAKRWNVNFYETLKQAEDQNILDIDLIDTELFFQSTL
jgi:SAM-dependent methyltransferase